MEDTRERNLDALREAAKLRLESQKKQQEEQEVQKQEYDSDDPYASLRAESEEYEAPTSIPSVDMDNNPSIDIKHEPPGEGFNEALDMAYSLQYDEEAIYEGGPTPSHLNIWKQQFPHSQIMHTKILERDFVVRSMNRYEYKQLVAIPNIDALTREEIICKTCVLWPMNYDYRTMAMQDSGYPGTLAQIIMEASGFTNEYGIEVL